ncbi:unnamed protein product [Paramecium pentaurelia]|uniref:Uncharacterized protein n=1 Tax=Paramecium pentaurelia TaxID=43138 RepID=A0A8S1TQF5_9CILI|nr:unnamed protein product [Paramecium pentaurelia]
MQNLITRINKHLQLIAKEEQNVDLKRMNLVSQKGIDTKQIFESIAMPTMNFKCLNQFLIHYQIEHDDQFVYSFLYRHTGLKKFEMDYEDFLNFIMPCEDDDLYTITKNKEHLGGARTIFSLQTSQALFDLFYAEVHYHFEIERSKKELFRDFEYRLLVHPLCEHKYIIKEQLSQFDFNDEDQKRIWRRLNYMQRNCYKDEKYKCKNFKSLLFPEDYFENLKLIGQPVYLDEQVQNQYAKPNQYSKNTRKSKFIECPRNNRCQFYQNYDFLKPYYGDKFIVDYNKIYNK